MEVFIKLTWERRRDARLVLQRFIQSEEFKSLNRPVQLAILTINPSLKELY
ncbi:hypothetical protein [Bullifex porci]|uniref:hypothetical protein n=1 Tax=Bullifex porci TaxID=2606638 RepID=UPI0023EFA7CC|nr:hypothetical protein [Bullifex porci]MDD7255512.1 hypothetical protein [Bullifex porci]MDY2740265.1 hypothetical protein [Bullifex porci]